MPSTRLVIAVAATLLAAGCATRDPAPYVAGKDCFYPACAIAVEVVDDGKGGKTLQVEGGGNIRMGTRHRFVAIVWNLKTPGYEFRGNSVRPHAGSVGETGTNAGEWYAQIIPHSHLYNSISVTNQNTERVALSYDLTVYPSGGTAGPPMAMNRVILNDAHQGREHGYLMMK